jgi:hypothetical protein
MRPQFVTSPKGRVNVNEVLFDGGDNPGHSLALGTWGSTKMASWNGPGDKGIGYPQSRGLPQWFVVPDLYAKAILACHKDLSAKKRQFAETFLGY